MELAINSQVLLARKTDLSAEIELRTADSAKDALLHRLATRLRHIAVSETLSLGFDAGISNICHAHTAKRIPNLQVLTFILFDFLQVAERHADAELETQRVGIFKGLPLLGVFLCLLTNLSESALMFEAPLIGLDVRAT